MANEKNKEALAIVKQMIADGQVAQDVAEKYFPELKGSEDEKIMKRIKYFINATSKGELEKYAIIKEDAIAWLEKQGEQKPAWSEEDEKLIDYVCSILIDNWNENEQLDLDFPCMGKVADQLKSLKDRVFPQPKKEWSDEDTEMIDCLIRHCKKEYEELCNDKYGHQEIVSDLKRSCRERWDWLESLKNKIVPQSHWKPTEEQIKALRWILNNIPYNIHKEEISGLLEQIQNL